MKDPVERLLDELSRFRLREFLLSLGPADAVVADPAFVEALDRLRPDDAEWTLTTIDRAARGGPTLAACDRHIVWALDDERACVERLDRRYPDVKTLGLLHDVLPRRAAGCKVDLAPRAPERGYVIVCLPRSGSYYLCGLLADIGLGRPDEHLDSGVCSAARRGLIDVREYLDELVGVAVENGWFGTKLVSHVLFEAFESGFPPNDFVEWLQGHRFRVVHLHRNDRIAQAVSNFFARHTGVWNVAGDAEPPERPPYDFDEIRSDWEFLDQQDAWLRKLLTLLPRHSRVDYEELDDRPIDALAGLLGDLTGKRPLPEDLDTHPRIRRQRDALSASYARRFAAELHTRGG